MTNLLKSLMTGALFLAVSSASAGTLYWQVTSDAGQTFDEAWLVVQNGDALTYLDGVQSDGASPSSTALTQTDISAYEGDGYLFYVEMSNYNSQSDTYSTVATGYKWTYSELQSSGYVASNPLDTAPAAASNSNFGSAIPEPSSGLLLLIGGAMLALRRRRQK